MSLAAVIFAIITLSSFENQFRPNSIYKVSNSERGQL